MKYLLLVLFVISISCQDKKDCQDSDCRQNCECPALSPDQIQANSQLTAVLKNAFLSKEALDDGYAYHFDKSKVTLIQINQISGLVENCCLKFSFSISYNEAPSQIVLRVTGDGNVKSYLEQNIGL